MEGRLTVPLGKGLRSATKKRSVKHKEPNEDGFPSAEEVCGQKGESAGKGGSLHAKGLRSPRMRRRRRFSKSPMPSLSWGEKGRCRREERW